jgi:Glyoxalase superfamily protein
MKNVDFENTNTHATDTTDLIKFAKVRARKLRTYLATQNINLSHSQSLEATAQCDGFKDWNTYAARFKLVEASIPSLDVPDTKNAFPLEVGDCVTGTFRGAAFKGTLLGLEKTITGGVWRTKLDFDTPVKIPSPEALNHTRRRMQLMLNANGQSVNLKGTPDGHAAINMP